MKYSVRVVLALLVCLLTVNVFAVDASSAVTCYWKNASGTPIGRTQQNCYGSSSSSLYSGHTWDEAATVTCNSYPCTLGAICEGGLDWYQVDGACSCISPSFVDALTPQSEGGECPNNPAGCPTLVASPSCSY